MLLRSLAAAISGCVLSTIGCGGPTAVPLPTQLALADDPTAASPSPSPGEAVARAETAAPAAGDEKAPPASLWKRSAGEDWPQFLGPLGTSVSKETGVLKTWPKEGLKVVWRKKVGTGYGMPSIQGGRLYQFDRRGGKARLTCMQAETGDDLWTFEYPTNYEDYYGYNNGPRCAPLVEDGRVYLYGPEGMLHCLDALRGAKLWRVDTKADYGVVQNFFGVGSCPIVFEDKLLVQVGGSPPKSDEQPFNTVRGNGTGVVAFDKKTGKEFYRLSDELASYATPVVATLHGRPWCFVFARGGLLAFDPRTGKEDFHSPWRARILESVNAANPVVAGDMVLLSECYGPGSTMLKVKPAAGAEPASAEVVWQDQERKRDKILRSHWCTPLQLNGFLYGCSGRHSNEAELRCIEWATGRIRWSEPGLSRASLTSIDGCLLCWGETGELRLLKETPEKYDELAVMTFPNAGQDNWAAPIVAHGLLYLHVGAEIVCLELIPEKP